MKIQGSDQEVESKKAKVKLNQWVRLHDYNISQKVQVIQYLRQIKRRKN